MSFIEPENKDVEVFMEEAALSEAEKYGVEDYDEYDDCANCGAYGVWSEEQGLDQLLFEEESFEADVYQPKHKEEELDINLIYGLYEENEFY